MLLIIGAAAGASAIIEPDSVASLVSYAWGGMGAAFGPVIILALYWRRFNLWGAAAWIVTVLTSPPGDAITAQFDRCEQGR